jgi:hypothetical protein
MTPRPYKIMQRKKQLVACFRNDLDTLHHSTSAPAPGNACIILQPLLPRIVGRVTNKTVGTRFWPRLSGKFVFRLFPLSLKAGGDGRRAHQSSTRGGRPSSCTLLTVQGLGFEVEGLGCRVWDLKFTGWVSRFRVWGSSLGFSVE